MLMEHPPKALLDRASALRGEGRIFDALKAYERLVERRPDYADAQQHLGALLGLMGHPDKGEIHLRRAIALDGSAIASHALALVLMAQGRFQEAAPFYPARYLVPELKLARPNFPFPEWNGQSLKGKRLAIFPEGGFGDQIQFIRFARSLLADGAQLTILAESALFRLFQENFPDAEVIKASGAVEFQDPDCWTTTNDLTVNLLTSYDALHSAPYLSASDVMRREEGFRVGVKLKGNPNFANDALRSLPADAASSLISRLPGTVVSLEPEDTGAKDFAETAAIMGSLDLVVSVDTSVAHLAGALGRPCFTLIPGFATDWRWMRGRADSPWYPSMRLYRGDLRGNWNSAVRRLAADVATLTA